MTDAWFAAQPQPQRATLDALREIVLEAAPEVVGMPKGPTLTFTLGGVVMCALTTSKSQVTLVLSGPVTRLWDPHGLLTIEGKTGRLLKLNPQDELPREAVRGWLLVAAKHAYSTGSYPF